MVRLDPLISDIVDEFLIHRKENAAAILDAVEGSDLETVGNIGHDIEGTAGAFGFKDMALIGRSLQQAARESNPAGIRRLAEELSSHLQRLKVVYE